MVDKKGLKLKQPMKSILPKINSFLANKFQHHTQSSQIHPLLLPQVLQQSPCQLHKLADILAGEATNDL